MFLHLPQSTGGRKGVPQIDHDNMNENEQIFPFYFHFDFPLRCAFFALSCYFVFMQPQQAAETPTARAGYLHILVIKINKFSLFSVPAWQWANWT